MRNDDDFAIFKYEEKNIRTKKKYPHALQQIMNDGFIAELTKQDLTRMRLLYSQHLPFEHREFLFLDGKSTMRFDELLSLFMSELAPKPSDRTATLKLEFFDLFDEEFKHAAARSLRDYLLETYGIFIRENSWDYGTPSFRVFMANYSYLHEGPGVELGVSNTLLYRNRILKPSILD